MKKIISLGVLLALILSVLPINTAVAASGETVTKLVNVAKNKPVLSKHSRSESYDPNVLTDDNVTNANFWYGYVDASVKPNATIDLGRRYKLEKIRIFDRGDATMPTRGQFEIWGADKEDFSDGKMLFELNDNSAFPEKYDYIAELPQKPVCRYVRYQAKNAAVVYLREIQVFANVTATEISRNATTYTTDNASAGMGGDKAVDGLFTDGGSMYLMSRSDASKKAELYYSTLTIDLGEAKSVDMIEMYNRVKSGGDNAGYKGNFTLYGSNESTITDFEAVHTESEKKYAMLKNSELEAIKKADGVSVVYKKLGGINGSVSTYTAKDGSTYSSFPSRANEDDTETGFQSTLDNSEKFRYITYRKNTTAPTDGTYHFVQLAEVRLYQIHPEIFDISYDGSKITLDCSEEMDYDSLVNAISVTDTQTNKTVSGLVTEIDAENPYKVIITLPELFNTTLKLRVTNDAESEKGVALSKFYDKEIVLPVAIDVESGAFTDESGAVVTSLTGKTMVKAKSIITNNSSNEEKLLILVCAYDKNHTLIGIKVLSDKIEAKAQNKEFSLTLETEKAFTEGDYVTMHLWNGIENTKSWSGMAKLVAE